METTANILFKNITTELNIDVELHNLTTQTITVVTSAGTKEFACKNYDLIMNVVVKFILVVLGCVGNGLSVAVMWKDRKTSATAFLLILLAIIDTCLLFIWLLFVTFPGVKSVSGIMSTFGKYNGYIKAYGYPFASIFHMQSVYLVVFVTLQRYIAVCLPHRAKTWASVKAVQLESVCLFIFTVIFYSPRFWQRKIYHNPKTDRYDAGYTAFGSSYSFHMGFMVIAYYIFIYVIPLSILMFTTFKLIKSLKRVNDRKKGMTSSKSQSRDEITLSLIVVVTVFAICQLANPLRRYFVYGLKKSYSCPSFEWYYNAFSNSLVMLNSAINFVIYTLCGKGFRKKLMKLIGCSTRVYPTETEVIFNTQQQEQPNTVTTGQD